MTMARYGSFTSRNTMTSVAPSVNGTVLPLLPVSTNFSEWVPLTAYLPSTTGNNLMTSARYRYSVLPLPPPVAPPLDQHGDVPLTTVVTGARSLSLNCAPVRPAVGLPLAATVAQYKYAATGDALDGMSPIVMFVVAKPVAGLPLPLVCTL